MKPVVKEPLPPIANRVNYGTGRRVYTAAETHDQQQFIEQLYVRGTSLNSMYQLARREKAIGANRVDRLLERIRAAWDEEDKANRKASKGAAIRRIQRYIENARGVRTEDGKGWKERPNFSALARFEQLLADLQGTREPITIDLNVRVQETVLNVIAGLTPEELAEAVNEYDENMRLATAARSGLVIDTEGHAVDAAPRLSA
jgi:hypothetical protein